MRRLSLKKWFVDISISKKLYFTIGIMAFLILLELCTLWFSVNIIAAVRASAGQEGIWSKAQKEVVHNMSKYARTGDEADYHFAKKQFEVHKWDRVAFAEIRKERPDTDVMWEGVYKSGVHEDDSEWVVILFHRFGFISHVKKALDIFWKADVLMIELENLADSLHAELKKNGTSSRAEINNILSEVDNLNTRFNKLEYEFSASLSEAARWLDGLLLKLLFTIALTVEVTGIILAVSVSRSISKGINEIISTSKEVAKGNFEKKAIVYSKDEIGQLAVYFNSMIEEVSHINSELEQFTYVASHDLQEPLRTISNFSELLKESANVVSKEESNQYLAFISEATERMQQLIRDLMEFSRVGRNVEFEMLSTQKIVGDVLAQLHLTLKDAKAEVVVRKLPRLKGNEIELNQLFQNLIINAVKFCAPGVVPEIVISAEEQKEDFVFSVKDNGIGINKKYTEKVFVVFQRLHTNDEYPGTGIGLATCKKIIALHKGKIWIESKKGQGSTFYFSLPKFT